VSEDVRPAKRQNMSSAVPSTMADMLTKAAVTKAAVEVAAHPPADALPRLQSSASSGRPAKSSAPRVPLDAKLSQGELPGSLIVLTSLLDHTVRTSAHGRTADALLDLIDQLVAVARQREPALDLRFVDDMLQYQRLQRLQPMYQASQMHQASQMQQMQSSAAMQQSCFQRPLNVSASVQSSVHPQTDKVQGCAYAHPVQLELERQWSNYEPAMMHQGRVYGHTGHSQGYQQMNERTEQHMLERALEDTRRQQYATGPASWMPMRGAPDADSFWADKFFADDPAAQYPQPPHVGHVVGSGNVIRAGA